MHLQLLCASTAALQEHKPSVCRPLLVVLVMMITDFLLYKAAAGMMQAAADPEAEQGSAAE